jgi:carbohydrate-selective porin OprB
LRRPTRGSAPPRAPFLRAGWSQRRAALYEASVSTGFGYLTRQQDVPGLAVNWARPGGGGDLSDQWTAEVFYKYQATETFALTPDIQVVLDPPSIRTKRQSASSARAPGSSSNM